MYRNLRWLCNGNRTLQWCGVEWRCLCVSLVLRNGVGLRPYTLVIMHHCKWLHVHNIRYWLLYCRYFIIIVIVNFIINITFVYYNYYYYYYYYNYMYYTVKSLTSSYHAKTGEYTVKSRYLEVHGTIFYKFKLPEVQIILHFG